MTDQSQQFLIILKALADLTRLRILLALKDQPLCVCQIAELIGASFSTISQHLAILAQAGLVVVSKSQRWAWYSLPSNPKSILIKETLDWVFRSLQESPITKVDRENLKAILAVPPSTLRQYQRRGTRIVKTAVSN